MRKVTILAVAAFGLGGLVAATALGVDRLVERVATAGKKQPVWAEVAWPFPMDPWGKGKAFRCSAVDCGTEIKVFVRAKIGFCNCSTGVSDDQELARISDLGLFKNGLSPLAPSQEISVAWMKGRSQPFSFEGQAKTAALSVGFNDRCDAIIATAVIDHHNPLMFEPPVIALLNSRRIIGWAEVVLGL
jgi:hypothetical protein